MPPPALIIMPIIDCWDYTEPALVDCLNQTLEPDVLVINQGSTTETRQALERMALQRSRLLVWSHDPPLPSLGATWNRALDYAWSIGCEDALVVNNDVRLHRQTYEVLRAARETAGLHFSTAIGRRQPDENWDSYFARPWTRVLTREDCGGPDFSCFCITRTLHLQLPFATDFCPAYFEDNDYHRRAWLGGWGAQIAGLPFPFLHYASGTVNRSPESLVAFAAKFEAVRQTYRAKWGGLAHQERKITPWSQEDFDGVGTPGGYLGGIAPPLVVQVTTPEDSIVGSQEY